MADDKIALSIEIESDRAQMSLGELEAGYKGLREQLEGTNRRTKKGREEFKRLSTQMAQASKEIKNLELGFEGLDREQVASELGSVAGAVGDLTTSFVILGGESETMEQVGRNIEKAIMISMGLKGAIEGISSASKLWTNVLKQSEAAQQLLTLATKGWGKALIATGIGAIIALVATLVTKWDELTVAIGMATKEQKLNNDIAQEAIDKVGDEISASDKLQKTLNDESISREEKNKAIIELQDEYPNLLSNIDAEKDSLDDINKALELNTKLIMLRAEQEAIASLRADELKEKTKAQIEAQTGVNKGLFEEAVALVTVFEAEEFATAATNKQIAANNKQIEVLDKLADAKQKEIDLLLEAGAVGEEEVKKEDEREKKKEESRNKRATRTQDDNKKLIEDAKTLAEFEEEQARIKIQLIQDEGERARAEIEYNSQLELEALEKKGQLTFDAEMLIAQKKHKALADLEKSEDDKRFAAEKEAQAKRDEYEELLFETKLGNEKDETERQRLRVEHEFQNNIATLEEQGLLTTELEIELLMAREKALADIELARVEKVKQAKIEAAEKGLALAQQTAESIMSVNDAVRDNALASIDAEYGNEKAKRKLTEAEEFAFAKRRDSILMVHFERKKKMDIAMAAINTSQAILQALASAPPPLNFVLAGAAGAAGALQIAAISKQRFAGTAQIPTAPSGTDVTPTGPDAGGGAAITPVSNTSTILGNQQVFVTETDITNTQNNVSVIEESATF